MPALKAQLWQVIGIGNSVKNKSQFEKSFSNAFPSAQMELFQLED